MKKLTLYPLLLPILLLQACSMSNVQTERPPTIQKQWKSLVLKSGESYHYKTQKMAEQPVQVNLLLTQESSEQLKALWELKQADRLLYSTEVIEPATNLIMSSKAALITETAANAFVNTILMDWWSAIDYLDWEVGYKRAVQVEMLAAFMIEVVDTCDIASIQGFKVRLTAGNTLMADACLAPTISVPLSVIRYQKDGVSKLYSATLLSYPRAEGL